MPGRMFTDNGPGLPRATIEKSLDYMVRVSDKAHYVSPSRGQLGNALKCLWAAPYVLSRGRAGAVVVETQGQRYEVTIRLDPFAHVPEVSLTTQGSPAIKTGTSITIHWPEEASYLFASADGDFYRALDLVADYALFNPHAHVCYDEGGACVEWPVRIAGWRKWIPSTPTSPHWYSPERFATLVAAYIAEERRTGLTRTVRDLLEEFDGLSGVQPRAQVQLAAGLSRATLADLATEAGLNTAATTRLLHAMQQRARPVKPKALGILGQPHLSAVLGADTRIDPGTITYDCAKGVTPGGLPYVLEVACGWDPDWQFPGRRVLGYNHAPALRSPFPRFDWYCQSAKVEHEDPVLLLVHLVCPRLDAMDRGKTQVDLPSAIQSALGAAIKKVTKRWTPLKVKMQRDKDRRALAEEKARRTQRGMTVKAAAYQVMEAAYLKARDYGRLPANARQIMYAARPEIIRLTGNPTPWARSSTFTQTLLPDFINEHPDLTANWDVVFDARGHFREPHTGHRIGLGTVEVRQYRALWQRQLALRLEDLEISHQIQTMGPAYRYRYVLFVEKEGFDALLEQARVEERYDLALMSTKGMTVIAARRLIEWLSAEGATILVVHDFDKSGLEILDKFTTNTRRYQYTDVPTVIDLGLRLEEALAMGLESEPVPYHTKKDPRESLRECGASDAECDFLVEDVESDPWDDEPVAWRGQRIELNAMTSRQFLDWLEAKLQAVGVEKVVPDQETLAVAYRHLTRVAALQDTIDAALAEEAPEVEVPTDLEEQIRTRITETDTASWDEALWDVVVERRNETEDEDAD
jgi:DNA topoisomerase VI subunit B